MNGINDWISFKEFSLELHNVIGEFNNADLIRKSEF